MVRIATFNVNGLKARLPVLQAWLEQERPDVVLLQEIKCQDDDVPRAALEDLGYEVATHGQKTYNGVAILSRLGLEDVTPGLPGLDAEADPQARYLEALVGGRIRVASLYLPNGNPADDPIKYPYKLAWMERLIAHAQTLIRAEPDLPLVLGGDYNVCPTDEDVYDPVGWADDASCRLETRTRFRALLHLGFTDALRARHRTPGPYTFWDYQGGAWAKNHGLRIDHLLLNPAAADRLRDAAVDTSVRGEPKTSDHAPVWITLEA